MLWSREQRAFAVESFFSNGRSLVATQRAFRARFEIPPHRLVPGRNSILSWVNSFRECGSVAKPRKGLQRTIRTPENIERVRQSVLRFPRRSARKHAAAMGISDTTVRRILHEDLQYGAGSNKQHVATKNTAKLDIETEELKHETISLDLGKLIQQGRQSKGMSQKELATKINEKLQIITDFEGGRGIPNNIIIGKIERALVIKLRGKDRGKPLQTPGEKK